MPHHKEPYKAWEKEAILKIWNEHSTKYERERALNEAGITRSYNNVYYWVKNNEFKQEGERQNLRYQPEEKEKILHIFSTIKTRKERMEALFEAGLGCRGYNPPLQQYNILRRKRSASFVEDTAPRKRRVFGNNSLLQDLFEDQPDVESSGSNHSTNINHWTNTVENDATPDDDDDNQSIVSLASISPLESNDDPLGNQSPWYGDNEQNQ